jgi:hypothetical protein
MKYKKGTLNEELKFYNREKGYRKTMKRKNKG